MTARRHHPSIVQWDLFNEGCLTHGPGAKGADADWFERAEAVARSSNDGRLVDICSGAGPARK